MCVMSVNCVCVCVCVTGEAQLVFVILIEAPQLSMDPLCCMHSSQPFRFKPRTNTLTYQKPSPT